MAVTPRVRSQSTSFLGFEKSSEEVSMHVKLSMLSETRDLTPFSRHLRHFMQIQFIQFGSEL